MSSYKTVLSFSLNENSCIGKMAFFHKKNGIFIETAPRFFRVNASSMVFWYWKGGLGCFENTYKLVNLAALNFPLLNKPHIFQCRCGTQNIFPHTWKDVTFIQGWKFKCSDIFKSSYMFLKHPLGPVSLRLMMSQFKDIVTHTQKLKTVNAYFAAYGFKILCEISKVPFEISHKILNPYGVLKFQDLWYLYDILSLSETVPWCTKWGFIPAKVTLDISRSPIQYGVPFNGVPGNIQGNLTGMGFVYI